MFLQYIVLYESIALGQQKLRRSEEKLEKSYIESSYTGDFEARANLGGQAPLRSAQNYV